MRWRGPGNGDRGRMFGRGTRFSPRSIPAGVAEPRPHCPPGGVSLGGKLLERNFTEGPAQPLSGRFPRRAGPAGTGNPGSSPRGARLWGARCGTPTGVCVLDWDQHQGVGGAGPGVGVYGPAGAGGGGAALGPLWARLCWSECAAHPACPWLVRRVPGAACVHAGVGTWRAVLGMEPRLWLPPRRLLALTEKDLQRAVQKRFLLVVSPGGSSGVPWSGNVEPEAGSALSRLTALPWPLPMNFAVNLEQQ